MSRPETQKTELQRPEPQNHRTTALQMSEDGKPETENRTPEAGNQETEVRNQKSEDLGNWLFVIGYWTFAVCFLNIQ